MSRLAKWRRRGELAGLGVAAALGFAPLHFWPLTLGAMALLYVRLVRDAPAAARPGRVGFGTLFWFALGLFAAGSFWIAAAFGERGPEFVPLAVPMVAGLAVLLALFWALAGAALGRLVRTGEPWRNALLFASALSLAEIARGHAFTGFPWNLPAYAFPPGSAPSQGAGLVGAYGLSFVVLGVAGLVGATIAGRTWRPALGALGVMGALFAYGLVQVSGNSGPVVQEARLRLVSIPFRQSALMDPDSAADIARRYIEASFAPGVEDVTHVIWPESVIVGRVLDDEVLLRYLGERFASIDDTPPVLILQSQRTETTPEISGGVRESFYNTSAAITFDALGNPAVAATNDKRKLVPFGEFIPGGKPVEDLGMQLLSTALYSFTPAPEKRLSDYPGLPRVAPHICYEAVFPGLTPRDPDRPAQWLLNQSNDAWFGPGIGPAQHAATARYRAIEEALPLVRVAANGVTGVFDAHGRAVAVLDPRQSSHIDTFLPASVRKAKFRPIMTAALALINLLILILSAARRREFGSPAVVGDGPGTRRFIRDVT